MFDKRYLVCGHSSHVFTTPQASPRLDCWRFVHRDSFVKSCENASTIKVTHSNFKCWSEFQNMLQTLIVNKSRNIRLCFMAAFRLEYIVQPARRKKTQTIDYLVSVWQALTYSGGVRWGLKQPPWTSNNKHSAMEESCHYWPLVCVEIVKMTPSVINYSSLGDCAQAPGMAVIWWSIGITITSRILPRGSKPFKCPFFLPCGSKLLMNAVHSAWFASQLHKSQFLISFMSNPNVFPLKTPGIGFLAVAWI